MRSERQTIKTNTESQGVRWPVVAAVVLLAAIVFGLMFLRYSADKDTKDNKKATNNSIKQTATKPWAYSSVARRDNETASKNSASHTETEQAVTELAAKMVMLASTVGMSEEVEKSISELASFGDSAVPELRRLVRSDQNTNVREAAARGLAEIGSPQAMTTLLEAVLSETNDDQRRILVSALHALTNPTAASELAAALLKTQDPIAFPTVRDTLARVADSPATRIIAQVYHEDATEGWQQSNLMGALLRVNSDDAVSALREIVIQDTDFSLRSQAAIALGRIGNQEAIQSLLDALGQTQSAALKQVYVESLSAVNNKDSLNDLVGLLSQSTNETARYIAARALGNIPNEASADALRSAFANETSQTVKLTIEASLNKLAQASSAQTN